MDLYCLDSSVPRRSNTRETCRDCSCWIPSFVTCSRWADRKMMPGRVVIDIVVVDDDEDGMQEEAMMPWPPKSRTLQVPSMLGGGGRRRSGQDGDEAEGGSVMLGSVSPSWKLSWMFLLSTVIGKLISDARMKRTEQCFYGRMRRLRHRKGRRHDSIGQTEHSPRIAKESLPLFFFNQPLLLSSFSSSSSPIFFFLF